MATAWQLTSSQLGIDIFIYSRCPLLAKRAAGRVTKIVNLESDQFAKQLIIHQGTIPSLLLSSLDATKTFGCNVSGLLYPGFLSYINQEIMSSYVYCHIGILTLHPFPYAVFRDFLIAKRSHRQTIPRGSPHQNYVGRRPLPIIAISPRSLKGSPEAGIDRGGVVDAVGFAVGFHAASEVDGVGPEVVGELFSIDDTGDGGPAWMPMRSLSSGTTPSGKGSSRLRSRTTSRMARAIWATRSALR